MRTITVTYTQNIDLYHYNELSENAKQEVREWYLEGRDTDAFTETVIEDMHYLFPNSSLSVEYSLNYRQGDGLNINGNLSLYDFLDKWQATEKEKRTINYYLDNSFSDYTFEKDKHYCYSCKFIDKKYINCTIQDFIENLEYLEIKNINKNIIEKFFNDMIDFFEGLDKEYEEYGYNYFYEISDEDLTEVCEANQYEFLYDGTIY